MFVSDSSARYYVEPYMGPLDDYKWTLMDAVEQHSIALFRYSGPARSFARILNAKYVYNSEGYLKSKLTFKRIADERGYTKEDITGPSRIRGLVTTRKLIIRELFEAGASLWSIAQIMHRDHTTIMHHLSNMGYTVRTKKNET